MAFRSVRAAVLAVALLAGPAGASSNSSEITDMWWNPSESGWGVNIILQNNVAFMTFFVYDTNQNPVWYTAQLSAQSGGVFAGPLYATKGPWFGGPFPPANVTIRQAGTVTFTLANLENATLTYTVDGVPVTKSVQRQTWTLENFTGAYAGGFSVRRSSCNPSSLNGVQELFGAVTVAQNGSAVNVSIGAAPQTCNFTGTYGQTGKLGAVSGTYSCSDGAAGNFEAFEMTPTVSGFTARVQGASQFCQWAGALGGVIRAQ
jgi:hypothetical protein